MGCGLDDTFRKCDNGLCRGYNIDLPAFPGAGGGFDGDVLDAALTPRLIQPTTIGRKDGREEILAGVFRSAGIPVQIVPDMHAWQICHLAMVVPIADAYYEAADPKRAGNDPVLMKKTARRIRENMRALSKQGIKLSPAKMNDFSNPSALIYSDHTGRCFQKQLWRQIHVSALHEGPG